MCKIFLDNGDKVHEESRNSKTGKLNTIRLGLNTNHGHAHFLPNGTRSSQAEV